MNSQYQIWRPDVAFWPERKRAQIESEMIIARPEPDTAIDWLIDWPTRIRPLVIGTRNSGQIATSRRWFVIPCTRASLFIGKPISALQNFELRPILIEMRGRPFSLRFFLSLSLFWRNEPLKGLPGTRILKLFGDFTKQTTAVIQMAKPTNVAGVYRYWRKVFLFRFKRFYSRHVAVPPCGKN